MTFKDDVYHICNEVAGEFEGWSFATGSFRNKTLKHTELIVSPGFYFRGGGCNTQPDAGVVNRRAAKLFKFFFGQDLWILRILFQMELEDYYRASPHYVTQIFSERFPAVDMYGRPGPWPEQWIVLTQSKDYLKKVLADGIDVINKYFDLSSEENFLNHLPTGFKKREAGYVENAFYEDLGGIMLCIAALVRGDFAFVEKFASDDFKTLIPKREVELKKILAALPDLRRQFAETGKVI
ncbi:MAG: hypothetical protein KF796_01345 [Ramlibacter sp.]|nr:hypothetical protein [Ramlibacter sp.]